MSELPLPNSNQIQREISASNMPGDEEAGPLFILVHGTWASGAPWTQKGGRLWQELMAAFPGARVEAAEWSGANSFSARLCAAARIIEIASASDYRKRPKILIGHSHGGSAIVYALQQSEKLRSEIAGAIFLGTPFFALATRRDNQSVFSGIVILLFTIATLAASYAFGAATDPDRWSQAAQDVYLLFGSAMSFLISLLIGEALIQRSTWLNESVARSGRSATCLSSVDCPAAARLFLRTTGDEVALALASLQLLAHLSNLASGTFARMMGSLVAFFARSWQSRWKRIILILVGASAVATMFICGMLREHYGFPLATVLEITNPFSGLQFNLILTGNNRIDTGLSYVFQAALAVGIIAVSSIVITGTALFAAFASVAFLSTLTLFVFGKFSPFQALALELAAEPLPLGRQEFIHLSWKAEDDGSRRVLRHSMPYLDPQAIEHIIEWSDLQIMPKRRLCEATI